MYGRYDCLGQIKQAAELSRKAVSKRQLMDCNRRVFKWLCGAISALVSYLSTGTTLQTGIIPMTGTPGGTSIFVFEKY